VFKSELSSRVNNLFGGFDMTPVKSTPDKSSRLQQLESNIRDTPVDVSSPQQPAGGVAGVQGGKQKRSQSIKTMPIFASELTKRVQALFTGFDATPMKLAPTRRLRTDIQTIDDKEVETEEQPFGHITFGTELDDFGQSDLRFQTVVTYMGKLLIDEEINDDEASFRKVIAAKETLRNEKRPTVVKMQVSSSHLQFKSTGDSYAMWFIRANNDIVRVDRVEESWIIITFTPEAFKCDTADKIDVVQGNAGCTPEDGHVIQVFSLPSEEEAMDLSEVLSHLIAESTNLFV